MRLLILLALALPSASAALPAPARESARAARPPACTADLRLRMTRPSGRPAIVRRLGDEPPGTLALTVYREVGGCPDPAIVRQGIGYVPLGSAPRGR